jgi:hypothetical protein
VPSRIAPLTFRSRLTLIFGRFAPNYSGACL